LLAAYLKKLGNLVWRLNPYDELVYRAGVRTNNDDETLALNLADGFDAVYKGWTKGHRYAARKACREGVSVKLASTLDDWRAYYRVYEDSLRRWGHKASSIYSWQLFAEMFRRKSPNINLWLSFWQNRVIAGALCFYAKIHAVYWHGAALEAYFSLRPVNLLFYEAIKDACDKGYTWFDFNPSGGKEGVRTFKKRFGAEVLQCPVLSAETSWAKAVRSIAGVTG